jgi:hypothetical protein
MSDQTKASRGLFRALLRDVEGFRELAGLGKPLAASRQTVVPVGIGSS